MDAKEHGDEFKKIVKKYSLSEGSKVDEIADFLTANNGKKISSEEFAKLFSMDEGDARVFLSFIQRGIEFRNS